jgi:phosphoglycerol transferase MdoB-like AlkP superfamily enzyme
MLRPMLGLHSTAVDEPTTEADTTDGPPPPPPATGWTRSRQAITVVGTLGLTLLWAWLATIVLDASSFPGAVQVLRHQSFEAPALLPSVMVVWVVVLLVLALTGRLWLSLGLVTAITALLGAVNHTKLELRNDPLVPSDVVFLGQPSFLFDMVSKSKLVMGVIGLVAIVLLAWGFGWLVARFVFPRLSSTLSKRGRIVLWSVRGVVFLICLGLLVLANNFNEHNNPWRAAFDSTGLRWRAWDQRVNFQRNGFVGGLLYNTHVNAMAEPEGYSKAKVEAIAKRYEAEAAAMNKGRTATIDKTNVVIILSESFSNPGWLKTVKFPKDLIPKTNAAMQHTVSGKMLAPGFGSGTANTEYELLTGQSLSQLSPQLSVPYEQLVSHYKDYPSAVGYFLAHGHDAVAIHPFSPRMYARTEVFKTFGFSKFITKDDMLYQGRGGGRFIDDQSAFDEVLHQIDTHRKPVLAHLITMQNHMPYGKQYDDPVKPTSGLSGKYATLAGQYARGIARTDDALADMFAKLKKSKEPTAVIFYGDHLPPQVYPQGLVEREGLLRAHQTPFLIWSNRAALKHSSLPTTSPIQFMPKLFNALNVPIPPWFALLDDLDKQIPAMDTGLMVNSQDKRVKASQLTPEAKKVLSDYRMIMYDLSIGKRYSEKTMYTNAPAG